MSRGCGAGAAGDSTIVLSLWRLFAPKKWSLLHCSRFTTFFLAVFFQKFLSFWGGLLHKSGVNEQNEKWKTTKGGFTVQEMICKCWVLHIGVYS
jgi:hypothetical protein